MPDNKSDHCHKYVYTAYKPFSYMYIALMRGSPYATFAWPPRRVIRTVAPSGSLLLKLRCSSRPICPAA